MCDRPAPVSALCPRVEISPVAVVLLALAWLEKNNNNNGLFHFISIHPLWMSVNWCPGGYIDKVLICVRGVRIDFNLCQGVANSLQ